MTEKVTISVSQIKRVNISSKYNDPVNSLIHHFPHFSQKYNKFRNSKSQPTILHLRSLLRFRGGGGGSKSMIKLHQTIFLAISFKITLKERNEDDQGRDNTFTKET